MCGWGILVNRDGRPVERATLQAMANAVAHRGPDAEGIVELGAVGLAHRRLAVIDVNDRSNQPMRSGDNWLQFNGAIYNFRELRTELEALGHRFHTKSDTEVLLHALDQWWVDALPRLQGMFSFCFYDGRRKKLLLARDRFGIKPLCYHLSDRVFIAGSEAKQLLATGLVGSTWIARSYQRILRNWPPARSWIANSPGASALMSAKKLRSSRLSRPYSRKVRSTE
jgi:asparagine synthase (glutamine-hydrolysing)